ncbi:MAG: hypothetical protein ACXU82_00030 [Caulobacteraceae bacterium]
MSRKKIAFAGHPELAARVRMKAFPFEVAGSGAVDLALGEVSLRFTAIPVRLRIPFLHRRVLAGSVGPFGVRMSPVEARVAVVEAVTRGLLGDEDSGVDLRLDGACRAELDVWSDHEEDEA